MFAKASGPGRATRGARKFVSYSDDDNEPDTGFTRAQRNLGGFKGARKLSAYDPVKTSQPQLPLWREQDNRAATSRIPNSELDGRARTSIASSSTTTAGYVDTNLILKDRETSQPILLRRAIVSGAKKRLFPRARITSIYAEDSSDSDSSPRTAATTIARKTSERVLAVSDSDDPSDAGQSDKSPLSRSPTFMHSPKSSRSLTPEIPAYPAEIKAALGPLVSPPLILQRCGRLPFLLWNLREGFRLRCIRANIDVNPTLGQVSAIVQYIVGNVSWSTQMSSWCCPLCNLHGVLDSRAMLDFHLKWDHDEVQVNWMVSADQSTWKLQVLIPPSASAAVEVEQPVVRPPPRVVVKVEPAALPIPEPIQQQETSAITIKQRSPSPDLSLFANMTLLPIKRQEEDEPSLAITQFVPSCHPHLPPPEDRFGPAARYPFLPAMSEYGGPNIYYSCRPGGPKIYDIMGTLPMDLYAPYGWQILDREEEIFETGDLSDEDKVMHALWARWIALNRPVFIKNFVEGIERFLDFYWRMIYRAAGYDALWHFLLMMVSNRYIKMPQMSRLLRFYRQRTGMDNWEPPSQ